MGRHIKLQESDSASLVDSSHKVQQRTQQFGKCYIIFNKDFVEDIVTKMKCILSLTKILGFQITHNIQNLSHDWGVYYNGEDGFYFHCCKD